MKKELKVQELSAQEMRTIEGGSVIGRAWDWIKRHGKGFIEGSIDNNGPKISGGVELNF